MAEQKYIMIGGRLHSVASDHVVVGADEVWDDEMQMRQSEINKLQSGRTTVEGSTLILPK